MNPFQLWIFCDSDNCGRKKEWERNIFKCKPTFSLQVTSAFCFWKNFVAFKSPIKIPSLTEVTHNSSNWELALSFTFKQILATLLLVLCPLAYSFFPTADMRIEFPFRFLIRCSSTPTIGRWSETPTTTCWTSRLSRPLTSCPLPSWWMWMETLIQQNIKDWCQEERIVQMSTWFLSLDM